MSSIDEFLKKHEAELNAPPGEIKPLALPNTLELPVVVLSANEATLRFGHLDTEFVVARERIGPRRRV